MAPTNDSPHASQERKPKSGDIENAREPSIHRGEDLLAQEDTNVALVQKMHLLNNVLTMLNMVMRGWS